SINAEVKSVSDNEEFYISITPLHKNSGNILIKPNLKWEKSGEIEMHEDGFSIGDEMGSKRFFVRSEGQKFHASDSVLIVPFKNTIIISSKKEKSIGDYDKLFSEAARKTNENKKVYGADSIMYEAMQTVLAWDVIYEPVQQRVISPVSRIWNCNWNGWVLFDWDTYFAAYMYSLDDKLLAYANAIAITKEITQNGFIPNFGSGVGSSEDRSQPPVGSFVIWKIYEKYREKWFLEEVFNDLLTWNRWWENNRDVNGYLCWGSDPNDLTGLPEWITRETVNKQAAKFESGLDNSPMYDDAVFDTVQHKLMLADVGLISMYIWDCQYLSKIARETGNTEAEKELNERASRYASKLESLYDEKTGLYLNKDLVTGEFSNRLSPTHFYPLLTGIPDQKKAERMINEHFTIRKSFGVTGLSLQ
ncbi:MAG: hypothetical protein HC906_08120, partial [Bacteroidales bacterium]|nr:hypothetical protein [Bacteroidales bacterium]